MGMRARLQMLKAGGLVLFAAGWAVGAGAQTAQGAQGAQVAQAAQGAQAGAASGTAAPHHAVAARPTGVATPRRAAAVPVTAATPPMGWNSWNYFAGKVTDKDIRDTADLLVASGMRDAGYVYVNIDDTWEGKRDANGKIQSNEKFPDMKALADYVHSKGLKLGIYSSPGAKTCARFEGSLSHEEQDAETYAEWGIDYLKYDLCSYGGVMREQFPNDPAAQNKLMREAYEKMHQAIVKTGRPMVYSLCQYGWDSVWEWGPQVGANLWRTTGDISANFDRMSLIGRSQAGLAKFAAPGHWNDPDMLEVGNGRLNAGREQDPHDAVGDDGGAADRGQQPDPDEAGDCGDPDE